ncbi:hypothetical protein [Methylobacterium indicum]|uniref:hypothetical protein n=1 Tax=Methylobacterium indicum TaxID=1775910 RepID=UPI002434E0CF|nr:hypothetical protein [Methylobacterium indicum]
MKEAIELDGPDGQPMPMTLRRIGAREWVNHIVRQAEAAPRFEGNRRERRKAAAQARKGVPASEMASVQEPVGPDTIRSMFAEAEAEKAEFEASRTRRLAELASNYQHSMDWMRVQALQGRIIDTATPEQRAAREAAVAEEWERLRLAEEASEAVAGNPARPGYPAAQAIRPGNT